jgi:hypothetical protein
MQYGAWLIDEAWNHRRRRYLRLMLSLLAAAAIGVLRRDRDPRRIRVNCG